MKFAILIFLMTLLGSLGAACLKKVAESNNGLIRLVLNPLFILGGILYVASALMNLLLLKTYEYTVIFPLTTITYVWTIIIGFLIFKEKINFMKVLAVILIISGATCIVKF